MDDFASPAATRQTIGKLGAGTKLNPKLSVLSQSVHWPSGYSSPTKREKLGQSLHRAKTPTTTGKESLGQSLHRINTSRTTGTPGAPGKRSFSMAVRRKSKAGADDASVADGSIEARNFQSVPFFEKLCWVCEELDYPYEYADIVGSQFLGLDGASNVTHVDGHVPTMDELSEFLALAFICITEYADLTVVVLDDFQWVDAFSWKIFQVLGKKATKLLLICAARSHDKQALRRLSTAASGQNQLQSKMIEILLGPFDFSEIRQLSSKILGHGEHAISDALCTDIFQRTGGLPVYVIQVRTIMPAFYLVHLPHLFSNLNDLSLLSFVSGFGEHQAEKFATS